MYNDVCRIIYGTIKLRIDMVHQELTISNDSKTHVAWVQSRHEFCRSLVTLAILGSYSKKRDLTATNVEIMTERVNSKNSLPQI